MHVRKLLVLLVVVGGLLGLAWWLQRAQETQRSESDAALLPGFDRARLRALRVDNLERSLQLRIERGAGGLWDIVDPVQFPAELAVIEVLLDSLSTQHAKPVPDADPAKLSLDPPRVVLEVEEDVGGKLVTRRVEIGAVDLGDQWVYARADGRIFRTERALDTTLERDLPDWRSREILNIAPRQVIEVRRSGSILFSPEQAENDLTFAAVLDGTWHSTEPFQAQLDPDLFDRWLIAASTLRAHSFIDAPGPLEFYGLQPPRIRVELSQADGRREALLLAPEPHGELWYAAREGSPHVFRVSSEYVLPIAPPSAGLIDRALVRTSRDAATRIVLAADGVETVLERAEKGWTVRATQTGREVLSRDSADPELVADGLGLLERARLDDFLFGRTLAAAEVVGHVRVESDGQVQGGVLGPAFRTVDGVEGVLFRRDGDTLVSLVSKELLELARRAPGAWRNLELHRVPEIEAARIELVAGPAERVYAREDKGRWVRHGTTAEAKEFAKLVDGLLNLRALEIYPRGDERVEGELVVRIVRYSGTYLVFTLGDWTNPAGERISVYRTGERFARVRPELATALRALLAAD